MKFGWVLKFFVSLLKLFPSSLGGPSESKFGYACVVVGLMSLALGTWKYLEHGTSKKGTKKAGNTDDHNDGQGSNGASKKAKQPPPPPPPAPLNFDFENPPEKVTWCMGDVREEDWTPFIGDDMVEESVRRDWSTAFTVITTQNASKP